jgi:hypothetical protein
VVRHLLGDRTSPRGTICIARKAEGPTPVGEVAEGAFERFTLRVLALLKPGTADGQIYFKAQFRIMPTTPPRTANADGASSTPAPDEGQEAQVKSAPYRRQQRAPDLSPADAGSEAVTPPHERA